MWQTIMLILIYFLQRLSVDDQKSEALDIWIAMNTNVDSDIHAEAIWSRLTQVSKYSIKIKKKAFYCCKHIACKESRASSADPDQTAPKGAV